MDGIEQSILTRNPWVGRRPISVVEYHRMVEAGILLEDDRVELIEGAIVTMAPIGSEHAGTVNALNRLLVMAVGQRGVVAVQNPVQLSDWTEPQPDFAVLRARADDYRSAHPTTADVVLLVEIAHSSLRYDRAVKLPLYARHGIPEFWLVDIEAGMVEVYRLPKGDGYQSIERVDRSGTLEPAQLPGTVIAAGAVLG